MNPTSTRVPPPRQPSVARTRSDSAAALNRDIATLFSDAKDSMAPVASAIELICRSQRWDYGCYLRCAQETGELAIEVHGSDSSAVTTTHSHRDGEAQRTVSLDEAKRALHSGTPLWSADLDPAASAQATVLPNEDATVNACYIPVRVDGEAVGVLALFRKISTPVDEESASALVAITALIGQFVERRQGATALVESVKQSDTLANHSAASRAEQEIGVELSRLLLKFSQDALSIDTLAVLLDAAVSTLIAAPSIESAALIRFDAHAQEMLVDTAAGWSGEQVAGMAIYTGFATPDAFFRDRTTPLAVVSGKAGSASAALPEFLKARGIAQGLEVTVGLPLAPFGVLGAYATAEHRFHSVSAGFVQSVGGILGAAAARLQLGENLAYLAQYDPLTNLANRTLFREQLSRQLASAAEDGRHVAVLYIDLDGFKNVNDSHGHQSGDQLLTLVADRLRANVPDTATIGRQGGDEFAVTIGNLQDADHALIIADDVCEELGRPFNLGGREICVTASIGVAVHPLDGSTADELIKNADTAMYQGKQQGRNNFKRYSVRLDGVATKRRRLAIELHRAIEDEFELHYQPQVSLATGRIVGAEAFLRWWHPVHGILSAGEFIGVAEESGLIAHIGAWVLETACKQVIEWQRQGSPEFYVSVNVSPFEVRRGKLTEQVRRALSASGLAARHLELELTESGVADDNEVFGRTLRDLDALGVSIAIDDFGSTHSGLRLLKHPAIDKIKIDASLTNNVATDLDDATIAQSVITMAHQLQIDTVAKGVETEEQSRFLRRSRCDIAQGYLFGAPMQASTFGDLLTSGDARSDLRGNPPAPQFFPLGSLHDGDGATEKGINLLYS